MRPGPPIVGGGPVKLMRLGLFIGGGLGCGLGVRPPEPMPAKPSRLLGRSIRLALFAAA